MRDDGKIDVTDGRTDLEDADLLAVLAVHRQQPVAQGHEVVDELHALDAQLLGQLLCGSVFVLCGGCCRRCNNAVYSGAVLVLVVWQAARKKKQRAHLVAVDDPPPAVRHGHLIVAHGSGDSDARRADVLRRQLIYI